MGYDVYNVWDEIYGMMCVPCEYCDYCHGVEDDANDRQMVICMGSGQIIRVKEQIVKREEIEDPIGPQEEEEKEEN